MPIIGSTNYHTLSNVTYTGVVNVDDLLNDLDGGNPTDIYYYYVYLDHGDIVTVNAHIRIHQPTTNLNNNTEAIYNIPPFGLFLDGTISPDHGDFNRDFGPTTITNDGPGRWLYFELWSTFGAVEFDVVFGPIEHLDDQPPHGPYTIDPSTKTSGGSGGWNVGNA